MSFQDSKRRRKFRRLFLRYINLDGAIRTVFYFVGLIHESTAFFGQFVNCPYNMIYISYEAHHNHTLKGSASSFLCSKFLFRLVNLLYISILFRKNATAIFLHIKPFFTGKVIAVPKIRPKIAV